MHQHDAFSTLAGRYELGHAFTVWRFVCRKCVLAFIISCPKTQTIKDKKSRLERCIDLRMETREMRGHCGGRVAFGAGPVAFGGGHGGQ